MGGGCISDLCDGVEPNDAVTLQQLQNLISSSGGGGFTLTGDRPSATAARELYWDDVMLGVGFYIIERSLNGGLSWFQIAMVSAGVTSYVDGGFVNFDPSYRVVGYDPTIGYQVYSNVVEFQNGPVGVFACGDFGGGGMGAYTGGDLAAGQVYSFSSFTLSSAMSLIGNGETIIQISGDLTMTSGAMTMPFTNANPVPSVTVCGKTRNLSYSTLVGRAGGAGGQGGDPAFPGGVTGQTGGFGGSSNGFSRSATGADGQYATVSGVTPYGHGGTSGTPASPNGNDGEAGFPDFIAPSSTVPPGGGGGGGHGMCRGNVVFIVGGNVNIDSTSTLVGFGADGGDGGKGGIAPNNTSGQGAPGGGGGGGGGQGGDGSLVKIFHQTGATVSATPVLQLQKGAGGAGGMDGTGGASSAFGYPTEYSDSGIAGTTGNDGRPGSLELIAV